MIYRNIFLKGKKIYLRPLTFKDINERYLSWLNESSEGFIPSAVFPNIPHYWNRRPKPCCRALPPDTQEPSPVLAAGVVVAGVVVPRLYLLLAGNVVSDYCCKVAMTRLIGEASALAATMVITLQRFASLVFSATVLSPAYPPAALWAGIGLVALGSVGYLASPSASPGGGTRSLQDEPGRPEVQKTRI